LIVFQDASVAKRAYLRTIAFPPPILTSPTGIAAIIKPYDGPDAQSVIQNVNSRGQHNANPSRGHNPRAASISVFPNSHGRAGSMAANNNHPLRSSNSSNSVSTNLQFQHQNGREPSPTLPSLPSHPTLNALISSSLNEAVTRDVTGAFPTDPAILAASLSADSLTGGPRIGDPGKRMLGAALGVRVPSLGSRALNGSPGPTAPLQGGVDHAMREVQRAMGGLTVAE